MSEEPEKHFAICPRVVDRDRESFIQGSSSDNCSKCRFEVRISPSTRARKEELKAEILCYVCASEILKKEKEQPTVLKFSKEQLHETFHDMLRRGYTAAQAAETIKKHSSISLQELFEHGVLPMGPVDPHEEKPQAEVPESKGPEVQGP